MNFRRKMHTKQGSKPNDKLPSLTSRSKSKRSLMRGDALGSTDLDESQGGCDPWEKRRDIFHNPRRKITNHDSGLTDLSLDVFATATTERHIYVSGSQTNIPRNYRGKNLTPIEPNSAREKIVNVVSAYHFVRSGVTGERNDDDWQRTIVTISKVDAFVVLLNSDFLENWDVLCELRLALAGGRNVISVREPGFILDKTFKEQVNLTEELIINEGLYDRVDNLCRARNLYSDDSRDYDKLSISRFQPFDYISKPLLTIIEECSKQALVYVPAFNEECLSKLLFKISELEANKPCLPPVLESMHDLSKDGLNSDLNDKQEIALLVPPLAESLSRGSSGYHSSTSPQLSASENDPRKPIEDSDTSASLPSLNERKRNNSGTLPTLDMVSPSHSVSEMSSCSEDFQQVIQSKTNEKEKCAKCQNNMSRNRNEDDFDLSCRRELSSPLFLETNYLVYPFEPRGAKVKPYLVRFPADVDANAIASRRDSEDSDLFAMKNVSLDIELEDPPDTTPLASPVNTPEPKPNSLSESRLKNNQRKPGKTSEVNEKYDVLAKQISLPAVSTRSLHVTSHETQRSASVDKIHFPNAKCKEKRFLKMTKIDLKYDARV